MPREARQRREQGMHHVVVQGRRLEAVFALEEDKELYLETLLRYKEKTGMQLYAYCILENHAHMVLQEANGEDVSNFMRRVGVSYVYWYRKQHPQWPAGRELFRGRYMSEPIESQQQLLETVRYIHQEPVRLGLVKEAAAYLWSSDRLYRERGSFIDSRRLLDSLHFSGGYLAYMEAETNKDSFLEEVPLKYGRSDDESKQLIGQELAIMQVADLAELEEEELRNFLRRMRKEEEISIQQLARVTGIHRGKIQRL